MQVSQTVELLAVEFGVVHVGEHGPDLFSLRPARVRVNAWSGGHVEPLFALDVVLVVHLDECRFFVTGKRDPGRAVCFIADDEVKVRNAFSLRLRNHVNGLVGREHHGDPVEVIRDLRKLLHQLRRVRGRRVGEICDGDVFIRLAFPNTDIRAHRE